MKGNGKRSLRGLLCGALLIAGSAFAFDREAYEEPDVGTFLVLVNPDAAIYGIGFGHGTWLRDTPLFGDYFLCVFRNGIEAAWYTGVGLTLRLMARWSAAPFVGVGGSYNYAFSEPGISTNRIWEDRGSSYWGGHVEMGGRLRLRPPIELVEIYVRQTWTAFDESERDYWVVGISTRTAY